MTSELSNIVVDFEGSHTYLLLALSRITPKWLKGEDYDWEKFNITKNFPAGGDWMCNPADIQIKDIPMQFLVVPVDERGLYHFVEEHAYWHIIVGWKQEDEYESDMAKHFILQSGPNIEDLKKIMVKAAKWMLSIQQCAMCPYGICTEREVVDEYKCRAGICHDCQGQISEHACVYCKCKFGKVLYKGPDVGYAHSSCLIRHN